MKTYYLLFISALFLLVSSCGKEDPISLRSTGDYFPTALNNEWEYTHTTFGGFEFPSISTIIESSSGRYEFEKIFLIDDGTGSIQEYIDEVGIITKDDGDYIKTRSQGPAVYETLGYVLQTDRDLEEIFLKDYLEVGETWNDEINYTYKHPTDPFNNPDIEIEETYFYKVIAKNITMSVQGKTYTSVIEIEKTIVENGNSSIESLFYAKDIGEIKTSKMVPDLFTGGPDFEELKELVSYTLY